MKRKTIEQLYFEFLEDGLDSFEIDKRINTILFYRSMDEVSPSEALIRQSIRIENLAETGYYDMDMILDEGDIQLHSDVQESLNNLPDYENLAEQLREMKTQLNDLLIDKHLYNVIVKHNLDENDDSDDDSQDKDKEEKGD